MKTFLLIGLAFLFLWGRAEARNGTNRGRESFVVRYKHGDDIIPVTVALDFSRQTEYVMNMAPRATEKSMTFYDFKQRVITYKDLKTRQCFLTRMTHETLSNERNILTKMQGKVITDESTLSLTASDETLTPTRVRNLAGERAAVFCRGMKTTLVATQPHSLRRSKRQATQYIRRTYKQYGQQTNTYTHYGHETYVVRGGTQGLQNQVLNKKPPESTVTYVPSRNVAVPADNTNTFLRNGQNRTPPQPVLHTSSNPQHQWTHRTRHLPTPSQTPRQYRNFSPPPPPPPPPPPLQILQGPSPVRSTIHGRLQLEPSGISSYKSHQERLFDEAKSHHSPRHSPKNPHMASRQPDELVPRDTFPYNPRNIRHPRKHFRNGFQNGQRKESVVSSRYIAPFRRHEPLINGTDVSLSNGENGKRFVGNEKTRVQSHLVGNPRYGSQPHVSFPEDSARKGGTTLRTGPYSATDNVPVYTSSDRDLSSLFDSHQVIPHDIHVEVIPAINASSPLWTLSRGVYSPGHSNYTSVLEQRGAPPSLALPNGIPHSVPQPQHLFPSIPRRGTEALNGNASYVPDVPSSLIHIPPEASRLYKVGETTVTGFTRPAETVKSNEVTGISPEVLFERPIEGSSTRDRHATKKHKHVLNSLTNLTVPSRESSPARNTWRTSSGDISEETVVYYPTSQFLTSIHNGEPPAVSRGDSPSGSVTFKLKPLDTSKSGRQDSPTFKATKSRPFPDLQEPHVKEGGGLPHQRGLGSLDDKFPRTALRDRHKSKFHVPVSLPPGVSMHPRHPSAPYSAIMSHRAKQLWFSETSQNDDQGRVPRKKTLRRHSGRHRSCCHRKRHLLGPTATDSSNYFQLSAHYQSCCRNIQQGVGSCCRGKITQPNHRSTPRPRLSRSQGKDTQLCVVEQTCSIVYRTVGQVKICRTVSC